MRNLILAFWVAILLSSCTTAPPKNGQIAISVLSILQTQSALTVEVRLTNRGSVGSRLDVARHQFALEIHRQDGNRVGWSPKEIEIGSDPDPAVFSQPTFINLRAGKSTTVRLKWSLLNQGELQDWGNEYLASYGKPARSDISIGSALALDPNPLTYPPTAILLQPNQPYKLAIRGFDAISSPHPFVVTSK